MPKNYGPNVSGYLDPAFRSWQDVVFQAGKAVLDKELNLAQDLNEFQSQVNSKGSVPSGWLSSEVLSTTTHFPWIVSPVPDELRLQSLYANVGGVVIPVLYTNSSDGSNRLVLPPAPAGAGVKRTDLVILEVWQRVLAPAPSGTGKSALGRIWAFGNVKIDPAQDAALNHADDILDGTLGVESTRRVQTQYRLRVISGVDLFTYPRGIDDPAVVAYSVPPNAATPDGTATVFPYAINPPSPFQENGLWRAGDGNPANTLGTVDGYMYAMPLCGVFRRNSTAFDRNTNHNGGVASPGPSDRPDGLFYDILELDDIADLRPHTSMVGWDYTELFQKNLGFLLDNTLKSNWVTTPNGGGVSGHSVLWADEIGITNAHGGDGVTTGDTPGGTFVGEFNATQRAYSDRAVMETVIVRLDPPGGTWTAGDTVTIDPTAMEIYPYGPFNWAAFNAADVVFLDVVDAKWIGAVGTASRSAVPYIHLINGLGAFPISSFTIQFNAPPGGITTQSLFVTILVAYPSGLGLTKTPTADFGTDTFYVNNPGQLPAVAPVSFSALATTNHIDNPHREVWIQYETVSLTLNFAAFNETGPAYPFFFLPERAESVTNVLKNALPLVGSWVLEADGRTVSFTNAADYTLAGDNLTVDYTALRPMPQNDEQLTIYYETRAPQTARSAEIGTTLTVIPRHIGNDIYTITTGPGSQDEGYPYPVASTQIGGIYPSSLGTFNGDHELKAGATLTLATFGTTTGFMKLPTFVGYVPEPHSVTFVRGLGDTDIEGRTFFKVSSSGYQPSAGAQPMTYSKRHRNFLPMLAELATDTAFGLKGQLVLVLLVREAFFDSETSVLFNTNLTLTTTAATVFRLKGNLLNKRY